MADVTNGAQIEQLRAYMAGLDNSAALTFQTLMKALSGDIVVVCTPATKTKSASSAAWSETVEVSLQTADGEYHDWYNGPITLAITDTSSAGTASISPAAGARMMTDGKLNVTVSGNAAAWLAADTATLTASLVAAQGLAGLAASATSVFTFA